MLESDWWRSMCACVCVWDEIGFWIGTWVVADLVTRIHYWLTRFRPLINWGLCSLPFFMKDDWADHISDTFGGIKRGDARFFKSSWQCPSMSQASHYDRRNRNKWGRCQVYKEISAKLEGLAECLDLKCFAGCNLEQTAIAKVSTTHKFDIFYRWW